MSRQARVLAFFCAVAAAAIAPSTAWAGLITQTATQPLTSTDFGPGNSLVTPLVFQQFDTENGTRTLQSVGLSFHAAIRNDYGMTFTTPATITDSVATGISTTPGPAITLFQPDGMHALLTVKAPNDPTFLTRTVTYGDTSGQALPQEFNSSFAQSSPFYLAPALTQASNTLNLTAPADLAIFTGVGSLRLPVSASAFSTFSTSSGNGSGEVTTQATADATVTYNWTPTIPAPEVVPEPAAIILWSIGGLALAAAHRGRRYRTG